MTFKKWIILMLLGFCVFPTSAQDDDEECDLPEDTRSYSNHYASTDCSFRNRPLAYEVGNPYFPMEPGWQVVLEGEEDDELIRVEITVLNEVEVVDGVKTRVVEEAEYIDGELYEISRNFFAICRETSDIYYFGEEVDFYEDGEIISHEGAWRAGVDGATPGVLIPGSPMIGARFHQEFFEGEAEDRAEITGFTTVTIDDASYDNVLVMVESSALDGPCDTSEKMWAPGIGMIVDEELELVEAGFLFTLPPNIPFKQ